jgi:exodeoxyribonuclease-3
MSSTPMEKNDTLRLFSWNVNGLRAVLKKGFLDFFEEHKPDILGLQETKAHELQVVEHLKPLTGYHHIFSSAERKGYSGVALFSREKPKAVSLSLGRSEFDTEGRVIRADFEGFTLFNVYFPNGKSRPERLQYKMDFYAHFLDICQALLQKGENVIVCGDVNTAHKEIDLARPKANEKISGFLPEERAWIDRFLAAGFSDILRELHPEPNQYTWWDMQSGARARNVGWRIDYFYVSESLRKKVKDATILPQVIGSDHCPVGLELRR